MAGSMRDIKRRIKSVTSTKQITHAMELVASAKLRKIRAKADARREYTKHMIECMHVIANGLSNDSLNAFLKPNVSDNDLYVVVAADKGLAGGFNSNLFKFAKDEMQKSEKFSVIAVGNKAIDYYKRNSLDVLGTYSGRSESPDFSLARELGRCISTLFIEGKVNNVYIVYNRFISVISQKPTLIKLIPLSADEMRTEEDIIDTKTQEIGLGVDHEKVKKLGSVMTFEPGAEELAEWLIPTYLVNAVYGALLESGAGELAARRIAMENATDNANEIMEDLTLDFNRARQGAITQEITEIVSGAEAIS